MEKLETLFNSILGGVPSIITALLFVLLIWFIAGIVRKFIVKVGKKVKLPEHFKRLHIVSDEQKGFDLLKTLGNLGFLVVFLMMIPTVLSKLGMNNVAAPITNMVSGALAYIPSLLGAALLLFVGYLLSKIAREVVIGFSSSFGVDKCVAKITGADEGENKISEVLGNVVFALIIIPTIITVLDVLSLQAISAPLSNMLNSMINKVPSILLSVIMIAVGLFFAKIVGNIFNGFIETTGINKLAKNEKFGKFFVNSKPSAVLTQILKTIIIVIFVFEAINILNLAVLVSIANSILAYSPNLIAALLILVVVFFLETFVSSIILNATGSKVLATITKALMYVFATFMVLNQLAIAKQIVSGAFMFIMAGLSLAFVLAFGLGGKDFAKGLLDKFNDKMK